MPAMKKKDRPDEAQVTKAVLDLTARGISDGKIAEILKISRSTVMRIRKKNNVSSKRRRGQRGPGRPQRDESYFQYLEKIMPRIDTYLRQAAREANIDFTTKFVALVMYPAPLKHPNVYPYAADPEKTTPAQAVKIAQIQISHEMSGLVGVPGEAAIELAHIYKTADQEIILALAKQAVLEAGFVADTATVAEICSGRKIIPVQIMLKHWEEIKQEAGRWAPGKDKPKPLKPFSSPKNSGPSRNGKKGSGGGIRNLEVVKAWTAKSGY